MARGKAIIVTSPPMGVMTEGFVAAGQTFYPGMIVQVDPTVDLIGGRHTYKIYDRGADGDQPLGAFWVVTNLMGAIRGDIETTSITAGQKCHLYSPAPGEELNLLLKNITGTADDHAKGEILMVDDGTGMLIATTGSPETEVAVLMETVTDPTADQLVWCQWSGH